jgi:hypothetical protein
MVAQYVDDGVFSRQIHGFHSVAACAHAEIWQRLVDGFEVGFDGGLNAGFEFSKDYLPVGLVFHGLTFTFILHVGLINAVQSIHFLANGGYFLALFLRFRPT